MNATHTIKLINYSNNAAAVEAAILLSSRDAGARVVLDTASASNDLAGTLGQRSNLAELSDLLLAESEQEEVGAEGNLFYRGHTSAGHPWEVVLL